MTAAFRIAPVRTPDDLAAAAGLFAGYAASLPVDLGYQDFEGELSALPGKYAPPAGELFLARDAAGAPLGCVGLRPLADDGCCEMKRLFLLPAARGLGLGRALTEAVVDQARRAGYRELRLDTLASMTAAQALYGKMGFERAEPYYAPTPEGTVFMALWL
ncbi:GNAT family N-acetyltransferase [Brevundimonas sp.]|uniref:GNAT family N-acetyltransferase n=1 Tax=Brevundimonas sp. TaxID=1871086 RepID=UPI002D3DBC11|nr:GNAT family N-acetyltransferase [Brevundimonas sp.]HYD26240.1 GNAT family N-acetyltransferase [Brevundimonas sp.]